MDVLIDSFEEFDMWLTRYHSEKRKYINNYRIPPRKPLPLGMGMNRHVRRDDLRKLSCKTTRFLV